MIPEFSTESIPAELKTLPQWVCWRLEERNGKRTKPPVSPHSNGKIRYAKTSDSKTWSDFATAAATARRLHLAGVGLALAAGDGLTGIDLDHVLNPETGELDPLAAEVLARFAGTYSEISPSGTGIRIFCRGKPGRSGKNAGKIKWLEVYSHPSNRYLTVTGSRYGGAAAVTEQQESLDWLHTRFMAISTEGRATVCGQGPTAQLDADLIAKARKARNGRFFDRLWSGDLSAHDGDASAADLGLCNLLAFWTKADSVRMDRLFRQSGLMRPKWDVKHDSAGGRTYGAMTIDRAIAGFRGDYGDKPRADRPESKPESSAESSPGAPESSAESSPGAPESSAESSPGAPESSAESSRGFTRHDPRLIRKAGTSEILKIHYNAALVAENAYPGLIGYNEFRQRIEKRYCPPWGGGAGQWTDEDTSALVCATTRIAAFTLDRMAAGVMEAARRHKFNPAQDRLRALAEQWDGTQRLESWLVDYLGAACSNGNAEYLREIGAAWLKGVAARVLKPGCKRDDVLVLRGDQGIGKSTIAQLISDEILPDSFTDSLGNLDSKDAKSGIRGIIIAELGELSALGKSEIESIKTFVAARNDHFREAYGRFERDYPRTVSFIGTTNEPQYLKDSTGNRRWWPVTIPARIDLDQFQAILPQLLGEAARRVLHGERWHVIDSRALSQAREVRDAAFDEDIWTVRVKEAVRALMSDGKCLRCDGTGRYRNAQIPGRDGVEGHCNNCNGSGRMAGANPDYVTIPGILDAIGIPVLHQTPMAKRRVGSVLRMLRFTEYRRRTADGDRFLAWRRPFQPATDCPPSPPSGHQDSDSVDRSKPAQIGPQPPSPPSPPNIFKTETSKSPTCGQDDDGRDPAGLSSREDSAKKHIHPFMGNDGGLGGLGGLARRQAGFQPTTESNLLGGLGGQPLLGGHGGQPSAPADAVLSHHADSPLVRRILDALTGQPGGFSTDELARQCSAAGASSAMIDAALFALAKDGEVARINGRWVREGAA